MNIPRLLVVEDPAAECAQRLAASAHAGGHIALTGGATPRAAYEHAAALGGDWSGATLWWGDERCVDAGHEHSNYAMARRALLDRLDGDAPTLRRMEGERGPHDGARHYEELLADTFGAEDLVLFDLLLLGLGPDGHCASLFPGAPQLAERDRRAVGVDEPGMAPLVPRITLTLPVLNAAREVLFLVSGEGKADALRRAFGPGHPDPRTPASYVRPIAGPLTILADPAAAARMGTRA